MLLFVVFGAVSFVAGIAFYAIGAWPVFGFFGLDFALLYGAFRLNNRAGRRRQIIAVDADRLDVTEIDPSGRTRIASLEPYWARVELNELRAGISELRLSSRGRSVSVGGFLSDPERRELASALEAALRSCRVAGH